MNTYEDFLSALEKAIKNAGNAHRLSILSGVPYNSITRWRNRNRVPSLDAVCPLLPFLEWPDIPKRKDCTDNKDLLACIKERDALRMENALLHEQITALKATNSLLREVAGLPEKPSLSTNKQGFAG